MRKLDEYLVTIDTIYPDAYQREAMLFVAGDISAPASMPQRQGGVGGLLDRVGNWVTRRKGRQALLEMSDEQLQDVGLTRLDARKEAAKSRYLG
jgi:uncharacterized protein YjiS (DUF1127 family)